MDENPNETTEPTTPAVDTKKFPRTRAFIARHPRTTKIAGFTAGALVITGAVSALKNRKQEDSSEPTFDADGNVVLALDPSTETTPTVTV